MKSSTRVISLLAGACAVALGAAYYKNPQMFGLLQTQPQAVATAPAEKPAEQLAAAPAPVVTPEPVKPVVEEVTASFDTVRVEATGDAVIAGHAAPGSTVAIKWNGAVVGQATANAEGSFAIVPEKPLSAGTGSLTLESTKDGKTIVSTSSVMVAVKAQEPVVVAKLDPVAPTKVEQAGDALLPKGSVLMGAVDYDDQGNIMFSGKAPAGAAVRFYVDNALAGEATTDATGNWNFKGASAINVGTHTLRADAIDATGAVVSRAETPFLREAPDKVVALAQPAANPPAVSAATPVAEAAPAAAASQPAVAEIAPAAAPAVVPVAEPATAVTEIRRIVIQPGNNLWRVSRKVYGKGRMYTVIFDANRDQIKNPNRVYPGQILAAPTPKG